MKMMKMMKRRAAIYAAIAIICMTALPVRAEEVVEVPEEVEAVSEELGERYNICPELIQAICWRESRFQADAKGGPCIGIMQVYEKWHKGRMERLEVADLYDLRGNMLVATDYLAELFEKHGEAAVVLAAYHGESEIYKISKYTESILKLSAELERRNGK